MLAYNPKSHESYEPLFRWAGAYFGAAAVEIADLPEATIMAQQRAHATCDSRFMADAWVTLEGGTLGPAVCMQMAADPGLARLEGLRVLPGPRVWGLPQAPAILLRAEVHARRAQPMVSALVRRYGNRQEAGEHWEHDPLVRQMYDSIGPMLCPVVQIGQTVIWSMPDLQDVQPPALRTACLLALQQLIQQRVFRGASQPLLHTQPPWPVGAADAVAFREGAVWRTKADLWCPLDQAAKVVEVMVGDGKPQEYAMGGELINKTLTTWTHVRSQEFPGLRWMRTVPPQTRTDVRDFNRFLVRFPHRLFSAEVNRVLAVFTTLKRLENVSKSVLARPEINSALTGHNNKVYICVHPVQQCCTPWPHLWSKA